jgi:hypothetical protein
VAIAPMRSSWRTPLTSRATSSPKRGRSGLGAGHERRRREQAGGRARGIVHAQAIQDAQHPLGMRQHAFAGRQQRGLRAVGHLAHESQGPLDQPGIGPPAVCPSAPSTSPCHNACIS